MYKTGFFSLVVMLFLIGLVYAIDYNDCSIYGTCRPAGTSQSITYDYSNTTIYGGNVTTLPADNITAGTFGIGNFTFQDKLTVNNIIVENGTQLKFKYLSLAYSSARNPFGMPVFYYPDFYNTFHRGDIRYDVNVSGNYSSLVTGSLFDNYFDSTAITAPPNTSIIITINLTARGEIAPTGLTYSSGYFFISFYSTNYGANVSGQMMDNAGNICNMSNPINVASNTPGNTYRIFRLTSCEYNYATYIMLNITSETFQNMRVSEIEYLNERPIIHAEVTKYQANSLYDTLSFKNSTNGLTASISQQGNASFNAVRIGGATSAYSLNVGGIDSTGIIQTPSIRLNKGSITFLKKPAPATAITPIPLNDSGVISGSGIAYLMTYVTATGETNRSPLSITMSVANATINLTNLPIGDSEVINRKIYRSAGSIYYYLVATIDNTATSYFDNATTASIQSNPVKGLINTAGGRLIGASLLQVGESTTRPGVMEIMQGDTRIDSAPFTLVWTYNYTFGVYSPVWDVDVLRISNPDGTRNGSGIEIKGNNNKGTVIIFTGSGNRAIIGADGNYASFWRTNDQYGGSGGNFRFWSEPNNKGNYSFGSSSYGKARVWVNGSLEVQNLTGTRVFRVNDNGFIGVNTINPQYPLEINASYDGISLYTSGNISATGYNTHSEVFDKSTGIALDYIKDASSLLIDGKIDHQAKPEIYVTEKYTVLVYDRTINKVVENCTFVGEGCNNVCDENNSCVEVCKDYVHTCKNITIQEDVYNEVTKYRDAWSIDKWLAEHEQAIFELKEKNKVLEEEIKLLKER